MHNPSVAAQLSDQEKTELLRDGNALEFSTDSPIERASRTIHAAWLQGLAENGVVRVPIQIKNAVVKGPLNLKDVRFEREVSITDSEFTSEVEFSHASFQRSASFARSKFAQKAEFSGACIHALGDFRGTQSSHPACIYKGSTPF
jgi:hypothetical protein